MIVEKKDQESAKKICEDAYNLYIDLYNKNLNSAEINDAAKHYLKCANNWLDLLPPRQDYLSECLGIPSENITYEEDVEPVPDKLLNKNFEFTVIDDYTVFGDYKWHRFYANGIGRRNISTNDFYIDSSLKVLCVYKNNNWITISPDTIFGAGNYVGQFGSREKAEKHITKDGQYVSFLQDGFYDLYRVSLAQ